MKPLFFLLLLTTITLPAQPVAASAEGKALFRSNCAFCHGLTGLGGRGPNLAGARVAALPDSALQGIIKNGIPGTTMPAFEGFDAAELGQLIGFLRALGSGPVTAHPGGDAAHGAVIYQQSGCAGCHRIGNSGSIYGPELTRIGSARSWAYLKESLVSPSADISPDYEGVAVTLKNGKKVTGLRVNEDTFSLQLRLPDGSFLMLPKSDASEVKHLEKSIMPPYQLPEHSLNDLLAYLETLRGVATGAAVDKAAGVH